MKNFLCSFFSFIIYKSKAFISDWFKNVKWFCINVNKMIYYKRYLKPKLWSFLLWEFKLACVGWPAGGNRRVSWWRLPVQTPALISRAGPFPEIVFLCELEPCWDMYTCSLCPLLTVLFHFIIFQSLFCYVAQDGTSDPSSTRNTDVSHHVSKNILCKFL